MFLKKKSKLRKEAMLEELQEVWYYKGATSVEEDVLGNIIVKFQPTDNIFSRQDNLDTVILIDATHFKMWRENEDHLIGDIPISLMEAVVATQKYTAMSEERANEEVEEICVGFSGYIRGNMTVYATEYWEARIEVEEHFPDSIQRNDLEYKEE